MTLHGQICREMSYMSTDQRRTPKANSFTTTSSNARVEMDTSHDGFCFGITKDNQMTRFDLGIVYHMTKSAHFLPVKTIYTLDKLAEIYV